MTDIQTILLSQLNRHLVGSDLAKDIDNVLIDRFRTAKQEYRTIPKTELKGDVEEKRFELLNNISVLQSQTFFKVSNDGALTKMVPNLLIPYLVDQGAAAYEARSMQDLTVLELNLKQFQTVLDQAIGRTQKRKWAHNFAVIGSAAALVLIGILIAIGDAFGVSKSSIFPILSVPVTVVLWAAIGSFVAMLVRLFMSSDFEMEDPLRWFIARPVTGVVIGMVVYLVIESLLTIVGSQIAVVGLGSEKVIWLIAFLAGFSDRFCNFVVHMIVGRLGGAMMGPTAAGAPAQMPQSGLNPTRTMELLEDMSWGRRDAAMSYGEPERRRSPSERMAAGPASRPMGGRGTGDAEMAMGGTPPVDDPKSAADKIKN